MLAMLALIGAVIVDLGTAVGLGRSHRRAPGRGLPRHGRPDRADRLRPARRLRQLADLARGRHTVAGSSPVYRRGLARFQRSPRSTACWPPWCSGPARSCSPPSSSPPPRGICLACRWPLAAILGAAIASTDPVLLRGLLKRPALHNSVRQALAARERTERSWSCCRSSWSRSRC